MTIELRLLEHALAVGEHRNFARAAQSLGLTQPSLSRSVAALENVLGVPLFDRTPKGVVPTAFGRVLLERGLSVLQREADLRLEIRALAGLEGGTLAVSAGPYPAETYVATAIGRLSMAHPRLQIRFMATEPREIIRDVLAERVEIGVGNVEGLEHEPRLQVEKFPAQRFRLACRPGHPLTKEAAPALARILEYPLVTTVLRGPQAVLAAGAGVKRAVEAHGAVEYIPQILVNSVALGLRIARESDAVFPATAAHLVDDLAAGRLVVLDFDVPATRSASGVFRLRDRTLSPGARAFLDILREVEAETREADAALPAGPAPAAVKGRGSRRR